MIRKGADFRLWLFSLACQIFVLILPLVALISKVDASGNREPSLLEQLLDSSWGNSIFFMSILYLLLLFGLIFCPILTFIYLYRAWSYIQDYPIVSTTPAKAVCFMLIPVFNIVWMFFAYYNWSKDYNSRNEMTGASYSPPASEGLFLTYCILTVMGIPILLPFVTFQMCRGINYLAQSEPIA